ncbi:FXSXX-COOH protein [Nonomuraea sp. NN258]|uniref:FxSxx-COOH cyclophane-containing RiPP peptide n=1 Tax=Nonomuraea antri TaxID=2730852 RepID=UPI001568DB41|nr:FxSxx-COOH cyclophane-containing RiPP peptide [Nonomuraea antri]NRQ32501.1 FXSXX-COOH protein [Nonomuraea antri]
MELRPDLVDLSGLDLERIAALPESVFASSLERIFRELSGDEEPSFVQHQSSAAQWE